MKMVKEHIGILLVDETKEKRDATRLLLEELGFTNVVEASDGQVALNYLQNPESQYRLVVTGTSMPYMDGFGLLKSIRETDSLRHLLVFVITKRGNRGDTALAGTLGANGYLPEPLALEELREKFAFFEARLAASLRGADSERRAV